MKNPSYSSSYELVKIVWKMWKKCLIMESQKTKKNDIGIIYLTLFRDTFCFLPKQTTQSTEYSKLLSFLCHVKTFFRPPPQKKRIKYVIATYDFKSLFFVSRAFIFITCGTCVMRKDGDGTSVYLFTKK
jgi:hypothetical protein